MKKHIKNLIIKLAKKLKKKNYTLVTAESCTGGGLAYFLSSYPAASSFLERGIVAYSKQAKRDLLGIKIATLKKYGAVSKEIAKQMAISALKNSTAHVSIAITGLAGPDKDDSSNVSVGTIWIGLCDKKKKIKLVKKKFNGNRVQVLEKTIVAALKEIYLFI